MAVVQVLMTVDGIFANVLKFKPPMVFSTDDADRLLHTLRASLQELSSAKSDVAALQQRMMLGIQPGQKTAQAYFHSLAAQE